MNNANFKTRGWGLKVLLLFLAFLMIAVPSMAGESRKHQKIATGAFHTVAIKSDGTLWVWGRNSHGQLGNGLPGDIHIPAQIGIDNNWVSVAAGDFHTVAIKSDGTLWAWGGNAYGQIGNGSTANVTVPMRIGSDNKWASVAAGAWHTVAVKTDGTLWAWGDNSTGQLGDGTNVPQSIPFQIGPDNHWTAVAAGAFHTAALKSNGTLWTWGLNASGQLGDTTNTTNYFHTQMGTDNRWASVAAGNDHTVAIKVDGTLWAWGANGYGQLGDSSPTTRYSPVQIGTVNNWTFVDAGSAHTVALRSDGTLWTWGRNVEGQLGDGTNGAQYTPSRIGTENRWTSAAAGAFHTAALKANGALLTSGNNTFGQLGDGTAADGNTFAQVTAMGTGWTDYAVGSYHNIASRADGTVWTWGNNTSGSLGPVSGPPPYLTPNHVVGLTDVIAVESAYEASFALKSDGTVWAWGFTGNFCYPSASTPSSATPVQITGLFNIVAIEAAYDTNVPCAGHLLALRSDGTVWALGDNSHGQLGIGPLPDRSTPVQVGGVTGVVAVSAGNRHSLALQGDGVILGWGSNLNGQLGPWALVDQFFPVPMYVAQAVSIAAGNEHSLAIHNSGMLFAWGYNGMGQLGDGTTTDRNYLAPVRPENNWTGVTGGWFYSMGTKSDGTLWAWGNNANGNLGDGTYTYWHSPVQIGTDNKWVSVKAGEVHTLALKADGTLWATGYNAFGELGDATTVNKLTFVPVGNVAPSMSFSSEAGYGSDGVDPDYGTPADTFTYKVIYRNPQNNAPSYVRACVDFTCSAMGLDTGAAAVLHDGNYANGEQYVYTTTLATGAHVYYFDASDGVVVMRFPTGVYPGPGVSYIVITTATLPDGTAGQPYSQTLAATGGTAPYTWSTTGTLPAGITLSPAGVLSGTPVAAGSSGFTMIVTDAASNSTSRNLAITVNPGDTSAPTGSISINAGAASTVSGVVTLSISAADNSGTVTHMRFSNNNSTWSAWEPYAPTKAWALAGGSGTRLAYAQFRDGAGNVSASVNDSIMVLGIIDLTLTTFTAPGSAMTGTSISVLNTVTNQGSSPSVLADLKFYISFDSVISLEDFPVGQRQIPGGLPGGLSNTQNTTIRIPGNFPPGNYFIGAIADTGETNPESDEGNNTASRPITITSGIDFAITSLNAPAGALTGTAISIANTVKNQGPGASAGSYVKFYLSTDAVFDAADVYIGQRNVGAIGGGLTNSQNTPVTVPVTATAGSYYIVAVADANGTTSEIDEGNNTASRPITIASGIDFAITSFSVPANAQTGTSIPVPNTVTNQGTGTSLGSSVRFYISADAVKDSGDTFLLQRTVGALGGGAANGQNTYVRIPASITPGSYYILAIADEGGTNPESNEGNNTASRPITITSGIDLVVSSFSPPASAQTGTSVPVANTVMNNGPGASGGSALVLFLSFDATITETDMYIGQRPVGSLNGGASSLAATTVRIPVLPVGVYYIGAIADTGNSNPEYNEGNNTSSRPITITSGIDFAITSFNAPASAQTGTSIPVPNTVKNLGTGTSLGSSVRFYLSADAMMDSSDTVLLQRTVSPLGGGAVSSQVTSIRIPASVTPGSYYILAIADPDGTNPESNEGNNTASSPITIASGIDFAITSFIPPASGLTGTSIPVSNAVTNQGTGTSLGSSLRFYLSADAVMDSSDTVLLQRTVSPLGGGAVSSQVTSIRVPASVTPGSYYILAIADPDGTNPESNEGNNTASSPITIASGIDFAITSFIPPASGLTGTSIPVPNTVKNQGTGTSLRSSVRFYLSADAVIDSSDTVLLQRTVSPLGGGAVSSEVTSIRIPASVTPGSYYILAIADPDGTNPESNEGNNTASSPITISSGIDLAITSFGPPANAQTGTSLTVANTVMNNGPGTSGPSTLVFFLSHDPVITASDIAIGQRPVGLLNGGASSVAATTVRIPVLSAGVYYIGAIADNANTNPEYNEGNNNASQAITITSGIDFGITSFGAPASGLAGAPVTVTNVVKNNGPGTSNSSYLKFYLSADSTIDTTDIYLGQRYVGALGAAATSGAANMFNIPLGTVPGSYYIGVIADANGTNPEFDEANNTASSVITITPFP